jgi:hypothetical protein
MMDSKTAETLVSKYVKPTLVVVLVVLLPAAGYLWHEFKELSDKEIKFEKYRVDELAQLALKKVELEKREFIIQQREATIKSDMVSVQKQTADLQKNRTSLEKTEQQVSESQKQREAQEQLDRMISDFSELGVDIDGFVLYKGSEEEIQKRAKARAKFDEILVFSKAHRLCERYKDFFMLHGGSARLCN